MIDRLSWLGGIWDGEGTIGITKRSTYFVPYASVTNTNERLFSEVLSILDEHGIEYVMEFRDKGSKWKPAWSLKIESKKRVLKFLLLIENYLVSKREQAEIVKNWCMYEGRRRNLTEDDMKQISNVRLLNKRGVR